MCFIQKVLKSEITVKKVHSQNIKKCRHKKITTQLHKNTVIKTCAKFTLLITKFSNRKIENNTIRQWSTLRKPHIENR